MEFIIWVEVRLADKTLAIERAASLQREATGLRAEEIGLSLSEGKQAVAEIQKVVVATQFRLLDAAASDCIHCGGSLQVKDVRFRHVQTVFGNVRAGCRRYIRCTCRGGYPVPIWPIGALRLGRSTPELDYLLASWGSRMPYRRAAKLLAEVLPLGDGQIGHDRVRRRTLAVGQWIDTRASEPAEYHGVRGEPPPLQLGRWPMSLAIDGTYVRSDRSSGMNQHYVVAGRIQPGTRLGTRFAWVSQTRPGVTAVLRSALQDNGWVPGIPVTALADGADGLGAIVSEATGERSRMILDWFHISMRLRPIEQMGAKIARQIDETDAATAEVIRERLPGVRHLMWAGKWLDADQRMRGMYDAVGDILAETRHSEEARLRRFRQLLFELSAYLKGNRHSLTSYGEAHKAGLRISSATAESGMNHLINQRMGKRQPMRWTVDGAHYLLQVRCADVDDRLSDLFRERYPVWRGGAGRVQSTEL